MGDHSSLFGSEVHVFSELVCSLSGGDINHLCTDSKEPPGWPLLYPLWTARDELTEQRSLSLHMGYLRRFAAWLIACQATDTNSL